MDETGINEYANAKKKQVVVDKNFPGDKTEYPVERNTNSSTLVACIAADGTGIPPLLVVKHRTVREVVEEMCWTDEKVTFAHSESGFITRDIFMRWLREVFIPNVNETGKNREHGTAGLPPDGHLPSTQVRRHHPPLR